MDWRHQQNPRQGQLDIVRRLACVDPVSIIASSTQAASEFKLVTENLVKQQHLEGRSCDELIQQYAEFVDCCWVNLLAFKEFNFHKQRLDEFLQQHVAKSDSFPKLWDVMRMVLILSHGQASVEKAFSVNRQVLAENPLAWPGIRGERVLCQPSGRGREPEGAVIHRTVDHPVAHWWFECPVSHFYRQCSASGRQKYTSTWSGNVQSLLKG